MRARLAVLAFLLALFIPSLPVTAQTAPNTCSAFDAWVWAQTVYESDPDTYASGLDPDGNELACEQLPISGFAPVLWTDAIPASAEAAQLVSVTDGDTIDVTVNGAPDTVRLYHIDAPETSFEQHCGGDSATAFLRFVLQWAPNGTIYLEYDVTERDRFDRRLAYVWYELGGDVYLVNEAMVRNGFAESETFKPDVKYRDQLNAAEKFSVEHVLGVRLECGRFGQPLGTQPDDQQVRRAISNQPNQGQFAAFGLVGDGPSDGSNTNEGSGSQQEQPAQQAPEPTAPPVAQQSAGDCDPNYTPCVPNVSYDLDCADIGFSVQVIGYDRHGFDGNDNDGWGCETY